MSEYNKTEADKLARADGHSTPAEEARKAAHLKFLERQRSAECDKELALTMLHCVYTSKIKLMIIL